MSSSGECTDDEMSTSFNDSNARKEIMGNDSFNTLSQTKSSILEETLPPGVAPKGFVILDEDVTIIEPSDKSNLSQSCKPILKVLFESTTIARKYRKHVRKLLINLLSSNVKEESNETDLVLEIRESDLKDKSWYSDNSDGEIDSLFMVDTIPKLKDDFDVPTYGQKFKKTLEKPSDELSTFKEDCCPKLTCFNCLANHNLRDCKEPRNQNNINKNKKEFASKQSNKNLRYHQDLDQKFGHIVPGIISENLRKALGIKDNELPRHIYGMRVLGYPPGWLEEARLQHSGITLFNSDGVAEDDPEAEMGEIFFQGDRDKFDTEKIIEFPGFNIPTPKGIRDEDSYYWGSEKQIGSSKKAMLNMLSGKKADVGYKRKKLKRALNTSSTSDVIEMEVECCEEVTVVENVPTRDLFMPALPKEKPPINPPEPPPPGVDSSDNKSQESSSELTNDSTAPSSPANSLAASDTESANTQVNTPTPLKTIKVDLGTPILQSLSPFSRLPSSEKFSKNICDVINFENLPDSTGKYEQMTGLIQKVRTKMATIHKE
ncbi:zinc finger CCHC domain-containing protein 8 homolog [Leptopilina boulardi]|uniref:zinc finger CCHC domain-containing protein 8 homolog n=1 Tax=Leptopilina boulardi TaxID=63433 RepID=UPI0021F5B42F|nr:zinc finger CCHC domain-containing protein 8 homolog [Leptopilina boulardi]